MFCTAEIKKYITRISQIILSIALIIFVASCSGSRSSDARKGEVKLTLIADKDINPNERGQPAPLNLFVYNVKVDDVFNNGDFFEITEGNNKQIQDASSKVYEAILQPGESRTIKVKPDSDTKALGFVGAYRDIQNSAWVITWDLPERKKVSWWKRIFNDDPIALNVHFQKAAITIKKMG